MLPALPTELLDRLAKVAGMLGSDHHGERAAAALQATRIIREAGWTWRDVIQAAGPRPDDAPIEIEDDRDNPTVWRNTVFACLAYPWRYSAWELSFLRSLLGRHHPPSEKQHHVLNRLAAKAAP